MAPTSSIDGVDSIQLPKVYSEVIKPPPGLTRSCDWTEPCDGGKLGWKPLNNRLAKAMEDCCKHDDIDEESLLVSEWCSVGARLSKTLGASLHLDDDNW
mmetsp:Transcript_129294/g.258165  ORF Transcript_129294/g.258165 Transcript_129294/m.258165 type:complete len:99 (-) Transcript_129294:223-519(-)